MCGIAGIITKKSNFLFENTIAAMNTIQQHRGPDDSGIWKNPHREVFFGHQRLSIIDLTAHAHQPMKSHDNRYVIIFNGEIYNYLELRKQCEQRGSHFVSQSDTEVILECYRHWGYDAFKKFTGMWALAIYDSVKHQIVLSRDRFAIKPLYYGFANGDLYFASEPKALRVAHHSFNEIDEVTVQLFVEHGYLERGDWTFYKNIKRFPHAHFAIIELTKIDKKPNFQRYWSPPSEIIKISMRDATQELKRLLTRSIELHMRSDVPVGSCLSGGIDSSAITCIAANMQTSHQFNTFTTKYPAHPEIDETHWAQKVIDFAHTKATFAHPTYENFVNELDYLLFMQDEPFGSTSIFAQYTIFKKISESNIKVTLDGQGADEQFAGYRGLVSLYLQSLTKYNNPLTCLAEARSLRKTLLPELKYKQMIRDISSNRHKYKRKSKLDPLVDYYNSEFTDTLEDRLKLLTLPERTIEETLLNFTCEENIPQLLRYEDRNSMAFSIESRVPFLERELVEFSLLLPATLRVHRGFTKAVLREAIKGIIPEPIRTRIDKLGFPTPEVEWLRRAYHVDVDSACSKAWRETITNNWRKQITDHSYLTQKVSMTAYQQKKPADIKLSYKKPYNLKYDAVVMLTWSDWHSELRSNRYHYATRFAKHTPVIFVQPNLSTPTYKFESTEYKNIILLHIYNDFNQNEKQIQLLKNALCEKNIITPLLWVYNVLFSEFIREYYSPLVVYHATEDYLSSDSMIYFEESTTLRNQLEKTLKVTDLLIPVSHKIEENYCRYLKAHNTHITIENGCDYKFYVPTSELVDELMQPPSIKTIFYQGNIFHKLDFKLLLQLARQLPNWKFVFCGKVVIPDKMWDQLLTLPNVTYLGLLLPEQIRDHMRLATIGIIPFVKQNWLVKSSFPLKACEYLASGLPVVSVPIESLQKLGYEGFYFAETVEEFRHAIEKAAQDRYDYSKLQQRLADAKRHDYDTKFELAFSTINKLLNNEVARDKINSKNLKILFLYDPNSTFVTSIYEELNSFKKFSMHDIVYHAASSELTCNIDLNLFDTIVIHSSIQLIFEKSKATLSESFSKALENYFGHKAIFVKDNYRTNDNFKLWLKWLRIQTVFTTISKNHLDEFRFDTEFSGIDFITIDNNHSQPFSYQALVNNFDNIISKKVITKREHIKFYPYYLAFESSEKSDIIEDTLYSYASPQIFNTKKCSDVRIIPNGVGYLWKNHDSFYKDVGIVSENDYLLLKKHYEQSLEEIIQLKKGYTKAMQYHPKTLIKKLILKAHHVIIHLVYIFSSHERAYSIFKFIEKSSPKTGRIIKKFHYFALENKLLNEYYNI